MWRVMVDAFPQPDGTHLATFYEYAMGFATQAEARAAWLREQRAFRDALRKTLELSDLQLVPLDKLIAGVELLEPKELEACANTDAEPPKAG